MNSDDFLRQISAQAKADNQVPLTKLGYIDYDFNPSTYPQVLPRVKIDGQPLSDRGYACVSTYLPVPGDRVILLPHGISYLILGAVDRTNKGMLYPGQLVFSINNQGTTQPFSTSVNTPYGMVNNLIYWTDVDLYDPYGFWKSDEPYKIIPTIPGVFQHRGSISFPTNATGSRQVAVRVNGSTIRGGVQAAADMNGVSVRLWAPGRAVTYNGDTDWIEFFCEVKGNSPTPAYGGTYPSDSNGSCMEMYYVGPIKNVPTTLE